MRFNMNRTKIVAYIGSQSLVFFDKAAGTMKSLKAGSNFTLKKGISCPDNGEGVKQPWPRWRRASA